MERYKLRRFLDDLERVPRLRAELREKEEGVEYERGYFLSDEYRMVDMAERQLQETIEEMLGLEMKERVK